ncbi:hypothetical protein ACJIZ3_016521 [Penstemon smallii]|uniref:Splicing factor 3A subunit 1 n=1 Tax=Penstemon smallii TaxID=265156 RepID=A0ABD3SSW8_9LAMI
MLGSLPILPLPAPPADGNLGPLPLSQVNDVSKEDDNPEVSEDQIKADDKSNRAPASVATHTRTIGIIYPPLGIRNIVDKTSHFVAKNGPDFEKRIILNNEGNAKFNFLRASDPYHKYYQHRLSENRAQNQASEPAETASESATTAPAADAIDTSAKPDPAAQFRPYTVRLPEGITGEELDIIKLTAQFIARNGKSFFTVPFPRPTHSMFMFFTSLADAYSKILMPAKGLKDKLRNSVVDMTTVLERCLLRLEWEKSQEQARQKAEDEIEQERLQMAMIDWHDFVVVETIDFADDKDEDLPPPMTLEEVIRRSKMSSMEEEEIIEPGKEVEMEMDEEEVQLVEEGMCAASLEDNGDIKNNDAKATTDEQDPPMRIVKNWKRPEDRIPAERDPLKYVVSPITGELILINEMSKHMRMSLIDPKYKEQKDRMFAKIRETTLAADDEISRNIDGLARTRPDIFGTTEEEKNDEQPKQVIWDGHTGSIGRTNNQAMSQSAGGEDPNDAMNIDGRSLPGPAPPPPSPGMPLVRPLPPPPGLILNIPRPPNSVQYSTPTGSQAPPGPLVMNMIPTVRPPTPPIQMMHMANRPPMPPTNIPLPPPPPPGSSHFTPLGDAPPPLPDEPEPKRQRPDDSMLIPEDQFLAQHSGPTRISISVPNANEGNLKGQVVDITVQSLSETVGSLKEKIAGEIQLPANKQKLSGKAGFLKDNLSLAYYNVAPGDSLSLSLRERGGRKR